MSPSARPAPPPVLVGWREWVAFPDLGLFAVRAKVDTGAATTALHAHGIEPYWRGEERRARFEVHPFFRKHKRLVVPCDARVIDERTVTSSSGHAETRLVIGATLRLGVASDAAEWPVEITLTDRRKMRFPMLLGRQAMNGRVHVDPGASFLLGQLDRPSDFYE